MTAPKARLHQVPSQLLHLLMFYYRTARVAASTLQSSGLPGFHSRQPRATNRLSQSETKVLQLKLGVKLPLHCVTKAELELLDVLKIRNIFPETEDSGSRYHQTALSIVSRKTGVLDGLFRPARRLNPKTGTLMPA